jgi:nitrous oxidase accessory protein
MGKTYVGAFSWKVQIVFWLYWIPFQAFGLTSEFKVCPTCKLSKIQQALDEAPEGATIKVGPGVYQEKTIVIKKSVNLVGQGRPILDGQNKQQILVIFKANDVAIKGFVFKDTGLSFTSELAGLRVVESTRCLIEDNRFENTTYGVYLEKSHQCQVLGNKFWAQAKDEVSGGNGVHIWTGSEHFIKNNSITGHRDGIYLEFVKSSTIAKNNVFENLRYGLHFMFSNSTQSMDNQFYENGSGVAIMYSQEIIMERNKFSHNKGTASYGLLLKDIHSSKIINNSFLDNTVAVYMEGSNRSQFSENEISNNGYGLRIIGNC